MILFFFFSSRRRHTRLQGDWSSDVCSSDLAIPPEQPEIVMNDKSHVSMEQHVCLVCGVAFDTGAILLDKRLRASMERHTTTGWGLCAEHQKLADDDFVALVECDPQRSGSPNGSVKPEQAYRTGRLAHLKRHVFSKMFNVPIEANQPCVFVEPGVIEQLEAMVSPARSEEHTSELQSPCNLVCRLLLEKKKSNNSRLRTLQALPCAATSADSRTLVG